jgi:hypothetical protein
MVLSQSKGGLSMEKHLNRAYENLRTEGIGDMQPENKYLKKAYEKLNKQFPDMWKMEKLSDWRRLYIDNLGFDAEFVDRELYRLKIPEQREGLDRLLVVLKGLTCGKVIKMLMMKFPIDIEKNLLADINRPPSDPRKLLSDKYESDRTADNTYAIWTKDCREADNGELKKLMIARKKSRRFGIPGFTLLERLLHEAVFFLETGRHLDIKRVTYCSGSHHDCLRSAQITPCVFWDSRKGTMVIYAVKYLYDTFPIGGMFSRSAVKVNKLGFRPLGF